MSREEKNLERSGNVTKRKALVLLALLAFVVSFALPVPAHAVTLTGSAVLNVVDETPPPPQPPQPVALRVEPPEATVKVGGAAQYRAIAVFSDGSERDVTQEAAWSVSDPQVASIGQGAQGGLATGLAAGQVDVAAAWQGLTGKALLKVIAPVRLEVRPPEATVRVGETAQYRAYLIWSDGTEEDVTEKCAWVVADGTDFAVPEAAKGLFRGKRAGRAIVKAVLEL